MFNEPKVTVLVVDDAARREARGELLRRAGYATAEAATNCDVLRLVVEMRPQLVVFSDDLPGVRGPEFCRRLKSIPTVAPLVLRISSPSVQYVVDDGADACLNEPVEPEVFLTVVRSLLRLSRAEANLHWFKHATDRVGDLLCYADATGQLRYVNHTTCERLGYAPEEMVGRHFSEFVVGSREVQFRRLRAALEAGESPLVEAELRRRDGRTLPVELSLSRVAVGDGHFVCAVGRDIAERRQAERTHQFLSNLADLMRPHDDPRALLDAVAEAIGERLGLTVCLFSEVDDARDCITVRGAFQRGVPAPRFAFRVSEFSAEGVAAMRAGRTMIVEDAERDPRTAAYFAATYGPLGSRAYVAVPLLRDGRWRGTFWAGSVEARHWGEAELLLLRTVAERAWAVAERLLLDATLRESEERFAKAFNASPHLMTISTFDEGRYLAVNDAVLAVTGYTREEMIGCTSTELGIFDHPEGRERLVRAFAATGSVRDLELRMRCKDGSFRTALVSAEIIEVGGRRCILTASKDITERKQAEEAVRRVNERFEAAEEAANGYVYEVDLITGSVVRSPNFCRVLGYAPEEVEMTREWWLGVIHPEDRAAGERKGWWRLDNDSYSHEYRARRKDGSYVYIWDKGRVFRDAAGRPVRIVGSGADITARKEAELQLAQALEREAAARAEAEAATRAKDDFLAVVSHELRSPLNAILGWNRILLSHECDAALIRRASEVIDRSARQQLQLIEDLLDTARIISGKLRLEVRPVELAEVVTAALDVVRPAAEAKGIVLRADLDPEAGQITGDPERLQQVVWNLLSNAIKFTPGGGRVEVAVERDGPRAVITVSDTGQGIAPDFLPHVFDRFRQADSSSARRFGGLGLGLALVKHLVEMHGGTVEAASEGPDKGATFTVRLPVHAVYRPPELGHRPQVNLHQCLLPEGRPALDGVRVLVVDDESDARELVTRTLKRFGAEVVAVGSAAEAFSAIHTDAVVEGFDALVSDIGLPDEDGYGLLRRVRALPPQRGGATPAVALTAYGRAEDRVRALQAGFQMQVAKPVDPGELLVVINALIGRSGVGVGKREGRVGSGE